MTRTEIETRESELDRAESDLLNAAYLTLDPVLRRGLYEAVAVLHERRLSLFEQLKAIGVEDERVRAAIARGQRPVNPEDCIGYC